MVCKVCLCVNFNIVVISNLFKRMNVLIIGKNSYIGCHIDNWLTAKGWNVEQLDVLTEDWRSCDYSLYDAVVHVAALVHRPKCKDWELYKQVNTDMPIEIASMAKSQGVKTYIFFSTMGVYGIGKKLVVNMIDDHTPLSFNNTMYGKSKLLAEVGLQKMQDNKFNIVIVRPPSVYGKGCKGGYITGFLKIARILPIIPRAYENVKQSFIYIDNLCEFTRLAIIHRLQGCFCPQDDKAVCANELLEIIICSIGKRYYSSSILGFCLRLISFVPLVKKAYGGIEYSHSLSEMDGLNYVIVPFEEGIKRTVL